MTIVKSNVNLKITTFDKDGKFVDDVFVKGFGKQLNEFLVAEIDNKYYRNMAKKTIFDGLTPKHEVEFLNESRENHTRSYRVEMCAQW